MRHLVGIFLALLFAGCTSRYVPTPTAEELIDAPALKPGRPLALVNKTPPKEAEMTVRPYTLQVDYRQYTDGVIRLLQREMAKSGVTVEPSSSRYLTFDLIDVRVEKRPGRHRCILDLTVTAGNGYVRGIQAIGMASGHEKAIDGAVTEAVRAILLNERIRRYVAE